jgi:hypothetical protein
MSYYGNQNNPRPTNGHEAEDAEQKAGMVNTEVSIPSLFFYFSG